jgi:hypothetical protein
VWVLIRPGKAIIPLPSSHVVAGVAISSATEPIALIAPLVTPIAVSGTIVYGSGPPRTAVTLVMSRSS